MGQDRPDDPDAPARNDARRRARESDVERDPRWWSGWSLLDYLIAAVAVALIAVAVFVRR